MTTTTTRSPRDEMKSKLERAQAISVKAQAEGRDFTPSERAEVKRLLDAAKIIKSNVDGAEADRALLAEMGALGAAPEPMPERVVEDSFAKAVIDAGFDLKNRPAVSVGMFKALGAKAVTFPTVTDIVRTEQVLVPKGHDRRWLWPHLVMEDARDATSIQDFKQGTRTVTGAVKRALDATTVKADLATSLTLVNEALAMFAVTLSDIPNEILASLRTLQAYLGTEGRYVVESAIDDHVLAQVVAAAPPFGTTGTTLVDKIRNGIATMRATGANPTIVVLNPTDAAALDLTADAGGYVFPTAASGSSSPLWGLQVVERIGAGTEPPYLIDPVMLGVLYGGTMNFGADPYTGFNKNLTTLRVEVKALYHVRNAEGARRIAAT